MKKVSVIVPIYNTEKYVEDCISSILNQTYLNIEIILVEDCSKDSTVSVLKKYLSFSNVLFLKNDTNRGVGYSRNRGIENSSGEYLMFVDSDDVLDPTAIEQLVFALEKADVDMSMCSYDKFFRKKLWDTPESRNPFEVVDIQKDEKLLNKCGGACWAKLFKRELFEDLRFPEGIVYEDAPVTFPAMIKARFISFVDSKLYHYRFNLNGITKKNKRGPNRNILDLYQSALLLDKNYRLVRRNDILDNKMKELGYNILFVGALNSGFWFQMPSRKEVANYFYILANQRYGYHSYQDSSYLREAIHTIPHFAIRMKYLDFCVFQKKYQIYRDESEIVDKIRCCLEEYLSSSKKKCKVKRK